MRKQFDNSVSYCYLGHGWLTLAQIIIIWLMVVLNWPIKQEGISLGKVSECVCVCSLSAVLRVFSMNGQHQPLVQLYFSKEGICFSPMG